MEADGGSAMDEAPAPPVLPSRQDFEARTDEDDDAHLLRRGRLGYRAFGGVGRRGQLHRHGCLSSSLCLCP